MVGSAEAAVRSVAEELPVTGEDDGRSGRNDVDSKRGDLQSRDGDHDARASATSDLAKRRAGLRQESANVDFMLPRWRRAIRHLTSSEATLHRHFDQQSLTRIEQAIAEGERLHRAELRFAIEADLTFGHILRQVSPRDRAIELFSELGIWDTEENVGVLIYLLWADHAVEIVADREVQRSVNPRIWAQACEAIVRAAQDGRPAEGAVAAIDRISEELARVLPYSTGDRDELPNVPIMV